MIVNCPNCSKQLKLGDKVKKNIELLEPGRKIKIKCVHCSVPFGLDGSDLGVDQASQAKEKRKAGQNKSQDRKNVRPPGAPDISWLKEGNFEDQEVVEDVPRALVLVPQSPSREVIIKAGADFGYLVEMAESPEEAIEKLRFVNYAAVFLHSDYEMAGFRGGKFHQYMRNLNMSRRRYIFYVLIGDQFETLYDLQALAYSANLVVNDSEVTHIGTVLKKAIPDYESLFGPLMEELRVAGK